MNVINPTAERIAVRRMQRALKQNPYDTELLLNLAALLGHLTQPDLDQKRRLLHRILYLEPTHEKARQMLLEMDRAEIGGDVSRLSAAVILTDPSSSYPPEKPLVLKYSIVHRFLVYSVIAGALFVGLNLIQDVMGLIALGAFLILPLWFISAVIEISDVGLHISRLFGIVRVEIRWTDIKAFRRNRQGMQIITYQRKVMEISPGIQGYPFILDILAQKCPDLSNVNGVTRTERVHRDLSAITSLAARTFK